MEQFIKENLKEEIESIKKDEKELIFTEFTHTTAIELGTELHNEAIQQNVFVSIDIRKGTHILFHLSMEGTTANNDRWVERKSNTVQFLHMSSYRVGQENVLNGKTLAYGQFLDSTYYADHGGSFPITVKGVGVIGAVTVSGLAQEKDHALVVKVLKDFINNR